MNQRTKDHEVLLKKHELLVHSLTRRFEGHELTNRLLLLWALWNNRRLCVECRKRHWYGPSASMVDPYEKLCERHLRYGRDAQVKGKRGAPRIGNEMRDAREIYRMFALLKMSESGIAAALHRSRGWVLWRINLLRLHPDIQKMIEDGDVLFSTARMLSKYPDTTFQVEMVRTVSEKQMNYVTARDYIHSEALRRGFVKERKRRNIKKILRAYTLSLE